METSRMKDYEYKQSWFVQKPAKHQKLWPWQRCTLQIPCLKPLNNHANVPLCSHKVFSYFPIFSHILPYFPIKIEPFPMCSHLFPSKSAALDTEESRLGAAGRSLLLLFVHHALRCLGAVEKKGKPWRIIQLSHPGDRKSPRWSYLKFVSGWTNPRNSDQLLSGVGWGLQDSVQLPCFSGFMVDITN